MNDQSKDDDVEILDIPRDEMDTENISQKNTENDEKKNNYMRLQDWLESDHPLNFQFDEQQYDNSIDPDEFSKLYFEYVTQLFKILQPLSENPDINTLNEDMEEQIGIVSATNDFGLSASKSLKTRKLSDAFTRVSESLSIFINKLDSANVNEDTKERFYYLLSIVDCLQANIFYPNIRVRPELLSRWINRFDYKPDQELIEVVMVNTTRPYLHDQFWNTYLSQLITRGLLAQAVTAISRSRYEELEDKSPALYSVIHDFLVLLESYTSMSMKYQFYQWKLSCCELRDSIPQFKEKIHDTKETLIINQIHDLLRILTGLPKSISLHCANWYEVFTALSLYQVRDDEKLFKDYYTISISARPPAMLEDSDDLSSVVETTFLNIMDENFLKVLGSINSIDSATAAYISRFLEYKGLLDSYYPDMVLNNLSETISRKTISEYLLTLHAYECLNTHELVPVGIGLLANPNLSTSSKTVERNRETIAEFLPNYKCATNDDLEWCLSICAKFDMIITARKLYLKYGKKSLEDGYIYEALNMFVNCFDPDSSDSEPNEGIKQVHYIIWDLLFDNCLLTGLPVQDQLLNNIIEHKVDPAFEINPIIRQCLSPYAVLVEVLNSMKSPTEGDTNNILSKLIYLLRFKHLPSRHYPLLLCQLIPLLMSNNSKFELPDLIVIIELLDNYETQSLPEDLEEGGKLYEEAASYSIDASNSCDWRNCLLERKFDIPKNMKNLVKLLRNEVVTKVGAVYISQK